MIIYGETVHDLYETFTKVKYFPDEHINEQVTAGTTFDIKTRGEISPQTINQVPNPEAWQFGVSNKSHYVFNEAGDLVGCANIIYLFSHGEYSVLFFDSLEIAPTHRKRGIGTHFLQYCLDEVHRKHDNALVFLLVVGCNRERLKLFAKFQFQIIDKRINVRGEHCLMTTPLVQESREISTRIFEFFRWLSDHRADVSSDCTHAHNQSTAGLYWCEKKQIFVSGLEKQTCPYYIKGNTLALKEKEL